MSNDNKPANHLAERLTLLLVQHEIDIPDGPEGDTNLLVAVDSLIADRAVYRDQRDSLKIRNDNLTQMWHDVREIEGFLPYREGLSVVRRVRDILVERNTYSDRWEAAEAKLDVLRKALKGVLEGP